jgi:hypothetical protein
MTKNISPEHELGREIYARFGLAMHYAQMLEFSIVKQLLALGITDGAYNTYEEAEAVVVRLRRTRSGGWSTAPRSPQHQAELEFRLNQAAEYLLLRGPARTGRCSPERRPCSCRPTPKPPAGRP